MAYIYEDEDKTKTSKKFDLTIKKYNKRIEDFRARLDELNKEPGKHDNEIKSINEEIKELKDRISYLRAKESDGFVKPIEEAANIDADIKGIIDTFNRKGYKTKYSSAGHSKLRKKEDDEPDGVYYGKLYSDARVQFDGHYKFPAAPKYWTWKAVDDDDYLDIVPISYNEKDGTPDEAFAKWKTNYMNSLKSFADSLKNASSKSSDEPKEDKKEEKVEESASFKDGNTIIDMILTQYGIR